MFLSDRITLINNFYIYFISAAYCLVLSLFLVLTLVLHSLIL